MNRITYEIAALEALREQLRSKEIWIVGANRFRNPDEDLPGDFETQRAAYYDALHLPLDASVFIDMVRDEMRKALRVLDSGLPRNSAVAISSKKGGWIHLTPLDAQPEPANLS